MDKMREESGIDASLFFGERQVVTSIQAEDGGRLLDLQADKKILKSVLEDGEEYFSEKRKQFQLPISGKGTIFQQAVWKALQNIPYGETRSYEDIAIAVKNPKAARAIGQANNRNPILIIVPCHRVIHKNGDITGFGCGTKIKKYLLDLEKRNKKAIAQ